ncbi:MAG: NADPH-dependent F420 reductase [Proteobacteria bacterium]|nr:NADPH-dependent F420 reductase [Pseudomonadota bacterium]
MKNCASLTRILIFAMAIVAMANPAAAETIAVIGTGDVATALGPAFAAQGHTIVYGSRDPSRASVEELVAVTGDGASATTPAAAAASADIVVLAVPGLLVEEIVRSLGDLSGKIIIDPTNPLQQSSGALTHAVETSNAAIIQNVVPEAHVVKAFNTLNWRTMVDPASAGGPVSIPLAGNNADAKKVVAKLVEGMGLEAIDVGGIENAHWVEGMLMLWINNRYGNDTRQSFDFHLRKN